MTTLAEIVGQYGATYEGKYRDRLLPSHRRVLRDIVRCRTVALGGHVYHCDTCDEPHYINTTLAKTDIVPSVNMIRDSSG